MITELRKELKVSDDEHRELLTRVNADEIIHRIRYGISFNSCNDIAKQIMEFCCFFLFLMICDGKFNQGMETKW